VSKTQDTFDNFDFAQIVNAMMRAKEKTRFWKKTLEDWSRISWNIREADVKDLVKSAWTHGKCTTANVYGFSRGKNVVVRVYVKTSSPKQVEQEFIVQMEKDGEVSV